MSTARIFESCRDKGLKMHELTPVDFYPDEKGHEMQLLQVYRDVGEQTLNGFGGAFTQASAQVYAAMDKLKQEEVIALIFGSDGLAYNCGRVPIGACDFSDGNYSYCDDPDKSLKAFSLGRDAETLVPFIKAANDAVPKLELMASPWSPPAWMKTNGDMCHGGELNERFYDAWADYFVRFIQVCGKAGVQINAVTVQNEPKAVQTWESCIYTAEQEKKFITRHLVPAMENAGIEDVKILIWDHNKERAFIRAREIFGDSKARSRIHGVAFHWYSGDHFENLALCRRFFPEQELVFTEGCVELCATNTTVAAKAEKAGRSNAAENAPWEFGEFYAHDIIGNLNAGMNRFIDWNLLLDMQGGPNHVGNYCSAPLICDPVSGNIHLQPSYWHIAHFSRFLPKGSVRLAISRYTPELEAVAARTPGGDIVVVAINASERKLDMIISDVCAEKLLNHAMEPHSIVTIVWPE